MRKALAALGIALPLTWAITLSISPGTNNLRKALAFAEDGDIVFLTPGLYHEEPPLFVNRSVHIIGSPGSPSGSNMSLISMDFTNSENAFSLGTWNVTFENLILQDSSNSNRQCRFTEPTVESKPLAMVAQPASVGPMGVVGVLVDFGIWSNSRRLVDLTLGTNCSIQSLKESSPSELFTLSLSIKTKSCHAKAGFTLPLEIVSTCMLDTRTMSATVNGRPTTFTRFKGELKAVVEQRGNRSRETVTSPFL